MYVLLGLVSLGYMLSQKRPAPAAVRNVSGGLSESSRESIA